MSNKRIKKPNADDILSTFIYLEAAVTTMDDLGDPDTAERIERIKKVAKWLRELYVESRV